MRESVRGWGLLEAEGMGYKGRWREGKWWRHAGEQVPGQVHPEGIHDSHSRMY